MILSFKGVMQTSMFATCISRKERKERKEEKQSGMIVVLRRGQSRLFVLLFS